MASLKEQQVRVYRVHAGSVEGGGVQPLLKKGKRVCCAKHHTAQPRPYYQCQAAHGSVFFEEDFVNALHESLRASSVKVRARSI